MSYPTAAGVAAPKSAPDLPPAYTEKEREGAIPSAPVAGEAGHMTISNATICIIILYLLLSRTL